MGSWSYLGQHRRALRKLSRAHAKDSSVPMVARFEPYCLRHTALAWLSPHTDPFTLAKIAGHASITMRYCHPQKEAVERAFRKMAEGVPAK